MKNKAQPIQKQTNSNRIKMENWACRMNRSFFFSNKNEVKQTIEPSHILGLNSIEMKMINRIERFEYIAHKPCEKSTIPKHISNYEDEKKALTQFFVFSYAKWIHCE